MPLQAQQSLWGFVGMPSKPSKCHPEEGQGEPALVSNSCLAMYFYLIHIYIRNMIMEQMLKCAFQSLGPVVCIILLLDKM